MSSNALAELLRSNHRKKRMCIDANSLTQSSLRLCDHLKQIEQLQSAQHIAAYIAIRGEISLDPIMEYLADAAKHLYLPVLRGEAMHFAPWLPGQPLQKKGFGLLEPESAESHWRPAEQLDLVLAPLVVFDKHCNRIGQGGGFYDRAFAFKKNNPGASPFLLGVAHESQQESHLPVQAWDVPLDTIVTDRAVHQRMSKT